MARGSREQVACPPPEIEGNQRQAPGGFDLLRVPGVRGLVSWRGFPYVLQTVTLAAFLALLVIGWQRYTPPGVSQKLYAQTNLATLVVWGLWWPAMVWLTVFLGRVWCMVCPLELISNVSERLGKRLGLRQGTLRPWVASGTLIVVFYAVIQLFVAGAEIRRVPAYTSFFLIGLLLLAVLTGLFLKDRAFCRGFCPVGLLLNAYGRGGMLAVRAGSGETCRACTGKDCIRAGSRYQADGRSCPSLLNVPALNDSKDCLFCGQCVKACKPGNVRLLLRPPFSGSDTRDAMASWPMTFFVMLVSGFVLWELTSEWRTAEDFFVAIPNWVAQHASAPWLSGYITGLWAMAVVPLMVWSLFTFLAWILGFREGIGATWRRLALPLAVVIAAGHMAKGLAKLALWAGFLPYALEDPSGLHTAAATTGGALQAPATLMAKPAIALAAAAFVAVSVLLAAREMRLAAPGQTRRAFVVPLLVMGGVSVFLVLGWGFPVR